MEPINSSEVSYKEYFLSMEDSAIDWSRYTFQYREFATYKYIPELEEKIPTLNGPRLNQIKP